MRIKAVKDIGTINLNNVEVNSGQIEIHIPVIDAKGKVGQILDYCMERYKGEYPMVNVETDIYMDFNITYSFGGYTCPEFEAYVLVWQKSDEELHADTCECYDFDFTLDGQEARDLKRIMWEKLGETILNSDADNQ